MKKLETKLSKIAKCQSIYTDTDSVFIFSETPPDEIDKVFNTEYKDIFVEHFLKKYNKNVPDEYIFSDLELEKIFTHIYFTDKKKRYYGIYMENGVEKKYIRGMSIIRKDTPDVIKNDMNNIAELSVKDKIEYDDFNEIYNKLLHTYTLKDIGIPKSFSKQFTEYKTKPQHVKAAILGNEMFNIGISNIDKPYMFFVEILGKNKKGEEVWNKDVICLDEENFDVFDKHKDIIRLDYLTFFDKQVHHPFEEFILASRVKQILYKFMEEHSDFYKSFFSRINRVKKKISTNKELTDGIILWCKTWNSIIEFDKMEEWNDYSYKFL